ncbi:MAG: PAS domain S-box protein [Candidatus Bathyarchaeota archaeon]|nr:PAS domain S-box protein [Candidatus Bathyarchaeota archaeon]
MADSNTIIRVLHVDGDIDFLKSSKRILSTIGYFAVDTATSVDEALKKMENSHFDVVLSDYKMPDKNGLDLFKALKQNGSQVPFILFTGKGQKEIAVHALNLGIARYIDKQGDPQTVYTELAVCVRNLYEKALAKKLLKESEERFERMVTNSKDLIVLTESDGKIVYLSPVCKQMLGYEPEELVGKIPDFIHPEDEPGVRQIINTALSCDSSGNLKYRIITKQGEVRWVDHSFSRMLENGNVKQIVSTIRDVTESKNAELRLRESEEHFRLAVQNSPIMMATLDCSLRYTWVYNHQIKDKPDSAFLGNSFGTICNIQDCDAIRKALLNLMKTGGSLRREVVLNLETGSLYLDTYFEPSYNDKNEVNGVRFAAYDITEHKLIEAKLRESEENCRFIAENAQDVLTVTNVNGMFVYVSPSAKTIFDYSPEELVGKKSILQLLDAEDILRLNPKMHDLVKTGQMEPIEFRLRTKTGKSLWLEAKISVVHGAHGEISFITISRDITERKRAQEERDLALAQTELLLEKLRVVGGFVQHDIRNKLQNINASLFLSKKFSNNNTQMLAMITQIYAQTQHIIRILEFAQTIQSVGDQGLSWVPVYDAIKKAQSFFSDLNHVTVDVSDINCEVEADVALIEIFHNLLDNSFKYGKNLRQIKIYSNKTQTHLKLIYEDNGGGIDPDIKPRLFQKGAGKGTGLGLFLIQRICDLYGWTVAETGEFGQGVRFVLSIPLRQTKLS